MSERIFSILAVTLLVGFAGCKKNDTESIVSNVADNAFAGGVVYTSDVNGKLEIWMTRDEETIQLTDSREFDNWWPRVSQDGNKILYYRSANARDVNDFTNASLRLLDRSTNQDIELIAAGSHGLYMHGMADWSTDENQLVFAGMEEPNGKWQLYTCTASGEDMQKISMRENINYLDPVFSPGGQFVYCVSVEEEDSLSENYQLYEINLVTGAERKLTNNQRRSHHPHVSDNGKKLMYETLSDPDYLGMGKWVIMELDISSGLETLVYEDGNTYMYPQYSANDGFLYAVQLSVESFSLKLCIIDRAKGAATTYEDKGNVFSIDTF